MDAKTKNMRHGTKNTYIRFRVRVRVSGTIRR
jgi:hypothetical protein